MKPLPTFSAIIGGFRYSVATAELLAGDDYFDGHNYERGCRNRHLYRTPAGRYFIVTQTRVPGERDDLRPVDEDEAMTFYEAAWPEARRVSYSEAFPLVEVQEA